MIFECLRFICLYCLYCHHCLVKQQARDKHCLGNTLNIHHVILCCTIVELRILGRFIFCQFRRKLEWKLITSETEGSRTVRSRSWDRTRKLVMVPTRDIIQIWYTPVLFIDIIINIIFNWKWWYLFAFWVLSNLKQNVVSVSNVIPNISLDMTN